MSLFKKKYSLHLCPDFTSAKKSYHAGERVKVCYNLIATDTDYSFSSPDVEMKQGYDDKHGYTFDFIMPERDVTINVSYQNRENRYAELLNRHILLLDAAVTASRKEFLCGILN